MAARSKFDKCLEYKNNYRQNEFFPLIVNNLERSSDMKCIFETNNKIIGCDANNWKQGQVGSRHGTKLDVNAVWIS